MTNPFALATEEQPAAPAATSTMPVVTSTVAPPPAPAQPFGGDDPFSGPAPQAARGPRLREMYGRLLLIVPHKLEQGLVSSTFKNPDGSPVVNDRMTADVVVLDGGPINYGGKPEAMPPVAHTKVADVPHKSTAMFISSAGLISQCREALAKKISHGQPGMVLGRLTRGEGSGKGEPPWLLTPPTDTDKQIARQYLATVDPFA